MTSSFEKSSSVPVMEVSTRMGRGVSNVDHLSCIQTPSDLVVQATYATGTYAAVCSASATIEIRPARVHFIFLTFRMGDLDAILTAELIVKRDRGSERERRRA